MGDKGEGGVKNLKIGVTLFMDGPQKGISLGKKEDFLTINFFSAGFDRVAFGWSVRNTTFSKEEVKMSKLEKSKDSTF